MNVNFRTMTSIGVLATVMIGGASMPVYANPQSTIQQERAAHPNLVKAIDEMKAALKDLEAAPDNFGGNKAVAMDSIKQGIHAVKKALYYRLNMSDADIDKAQ
ncbi:MAG: hypothetical protein EPN17_14375 [Methylobacter sp.]|nr:MAG: hypothetical protein EPN17_14375 [Methylobacter sp.]